MGTGIQFSEGTYDPATKTFTFNMEMEMMPGMKTPVREVIKMPTKITCSLSGTRTRAAGKRRRWRSTTRAQARSSAIRASLSIHPSRLYRSRQEDASKSIFAGDLRGQTSTELCA